MPENKVQIVVEVDAKTGQAVIRQLGQEMEAVGHKGAAGFGQASAGVDRLGDGVDRLKRSMTPVVGLAGQLGMAWGAAEIVRTADAMRALDTRLLLTARNTADYAAAQRTVADVAKASHQGLGEVGTLYNRLALSTKNLNINQRDLDDVTKATALSVALSGSAAQESSAGMLQFSQAMGAGRLQGDELRSVMENMPQLAAILVDAVGGSMATFREMAKDGAIDTEWLVGVLKKALPDLEAQAKGMPITVGLAINDLQNSSAQYIATIDTATGASAALAVGIGWLGENLETVAAGGVMVLTGGLSLLAGRGLASVIVSMPRVIASMREFATITETATVLTSAYSVATETTSRVSLAHAASKLLTMPNIIGGVTAALSLGAIAWSMWGNEAEDASRKAEAELEQLRRYNQQMKELADPGLKLRQAEAEREAARKMVNSFSSTNALGQTISYRGPEYDAAVKDWERAEEKYQLIQDNMALAAKVAAGKRMGAEADITKFEQQQAAEREKASADHLKRKLLGIEEERQAELTAAKSRFKNVDELARAERAVNSRFDAEAAAAKRDAAAKATKGQASAMRELSKTMDDYRDAVMASLPEEEQAVAKVRKEYDTYRESIEDGLKKHPELAGEATKAMAGLAVEEEKAVARTRERAAASSDLARVTDAYNDAVMESLPEQDRAVAEIAKRYDEARDAVWRWAVAQDAAGKSTEEVANEVDRLFQRLDDRQGEATAKALERQRGQADKTEDIWGNAYKNIQGMTADFVYDLEISWSSVGKLAWRTASEMVSAWGWSQAQMTWAGPSEATGASGQDGAAGSASSAAIRNASMFSNFANGFSNVANMAYGWGGLDKAAAYAWTSGSNAGGVMNADWSAMVDGGVWGEIGNGLNNLSSTLQSIPVIGQLGPGGILSAYSAYNAFQQGNTVGGFAHTAATAALFIPGAGPAAALGIEIGNSLGEALGLWGNHKGGPKQGGAAWSDYSPMSTHPAGDQQYLTEMGRAAAQLQTTFDALTNELGIVSSGLTIGLGYSADPAGDAQTIVSSAIRNSGGDTVWQNSHEDVGRSAEEIQAGLELEGKKVILAALQSLDISPVIDFVLDKVDIGSATKESADSLITFVQASEDVITAFNSIGLSAQELATSLQAGSIDPVMFSGGVWDVLTEQARQALQGSIVKASADFAAGNADLGTQTLQGIQKYITGVTSITDEISAAIADSHLSAYEIQLRGINQQFDAYASQLQAMGISLEKYTALEEARSIALEASAKTLNEQVSAVRDKLLGGSTRDLSWFNSKYGLNLDRSGFEAGLRSFSELTSADWAGVAQYVSRLGLSLDELIPDLGAVADSFGQVDAAAKTTKDNVDAAMEEAARKLEQINAIIAGIDDTVAHETMTDLAIQIESINRRYDEMGDQLKRLGANVGETNLELARAVELNQTFKESYLEMIQGVVETTKGVLQRSFDAAKAGLSSQHEATLAGLNAAKGAAESVVSDIKSYLDRLSSARLGMQLEGAGAAAESYSAAQAALAGVLANNRAGGHMRLDDRSLGLLTGNIRQFYANEVDYRRDYWKTYASLTELEKYSGKQMSAEQSLMALLDQQITAERAQYQEEVDRLDAQLNALLGIDTSIKSMATAIADYQTALAAQARAITITVHGGAVTAGVTDITGWATANDLPMFDKGTSFVPHDMTARIHEGEEITPRPYVDRQSADRARTNQLLERLLEENAELRIAVGKLQKPTEQTADTLVRVTRDGKSMVTVSA